MEDPDILTVKWNENHVIKIYCKQKSEEVLELNQVNIESIFVFVIGLSK